MIYNLIKPVEILESQRHMDGSEATLYFKTILGVTFRWKLGLLSPMLVEKNSMAATPTHRTDPGSKKAGRGDNFIVKI